MKILVLGGAGFIGQNLIKELLKDETNDIKVFDKFFPKTELFEHKNINCISGNFEELGENKKLFEDLDIIYHLISASVPGMAWSLEDEIAHNLMPSLSFIKTAVSEKVKRIVFLSSGGTVYESSKVAVPHKEEDALKPISTYGMQKVFIENILQFETQFTDTSFQIIRLSNPYGPGQNPEAPVGLVTKVIYRALHDLPIDLYGDGQNVRDFIYIEDAVKGIINITKYGELNSIYNLGAGRGHTLNEILATIEEVADKKLMIQRQPNRGFDVRFAVLDISKYNQISQTKREYSLRDGIQQTMEYFKKQINNF